MARRTFTYEGKRYSVTAKTESELNCKIANKKRELKKQSSHVYGFSEWYEVFLETYKSNVAFRTYESYQQRYKKHLKPYFKNRKISDITHLECQKFFNRLSGYSRNYIHKLYHDLHQAFDKAVVNGFITVNPAYGCILPSGHADTHRAITAEERSAILSVCKYHECSLYILLMLYCGLRPHETAYIQGRDIKENVLHVRGTKSADADRYVPLPEVLRRVLPEIEDEEYLIKSLSGASPVRESHRRKMWRSFKKELGSCIDTADDLVPYCLRHTYCTDLQDAGIPINVAREFMGHSTIVLTSKIYTHHSQKTFNSAAELINSHIYSHTYDVLSAADED